MQQNAANQAFKASHMTAEQHEEEIQAILMMPEAPGELLLPGNVPGINQSLDTVQRCEDNTNRRRLEYTNFSASKCNHVYEFYDFRLTHVSKVWPKGPTTDVHRHSVT